MRKNYYKYKALGICPYCSSPSDSGYVRCSRCLEAHARNRRLYELNYPEKVKATSAKKKAKRKKEHKCLSCSAPLDLSEGGMDQGYYTCLNCRTALSVPRGASYADRPTRST